MVSIFLESLQNKPFGLARVLVEEGWRADGMVRGFAGMSSQRRLASGSPQHRPTAGVTTTRMSILVLLRTPVHSQSSARPETGSQDKQGRIHVSGTARMVRIFRIFRKRRRRCEVVMAKINRSLRNLGAWTASARDRPVRARSAASGKSAQSAAVPIVVDLGRADFHDLFDRAVSGRTLD